jgi:hypothetical protein
MHKAFIWEFRHRLCRDENAISKSHANPPIASSGADPGCLVAWRINVFGAHTGSPVSMKH